MVNVTTIPDPSGDCVICGGGAKPTDLHLASVIHCIDGEVIEWLERREQRKRMRAGDEWAPATKVV